MDRVLGGWATALAVGSPWPVLALWWDADRAGYTLAAGFRRPVGYVWLKDGTPAGEDEAMRTFAARLGLDPVLDLQALEELTRPDPDADAAARLRGLLAVLTRTGLTLPAGLSPGESADRLRAVAAVQRGWNASSGAAGATPYGGAGRGRERPDRPLGTRPPRAGGRRRPARRRTSAAAVGRTPAQRRLGGGRGGAAGAGRPGARLRAGQGGRLLSTLP